MVFRKLPMDCRNITRVVQDLADLNAKVEETRKEQEDPRRPDGPAKPEQLYTLKEDAAAGH